MRDWTKEKNSVKEGIDCVRLKLNPFAGDPQLYLLKDDEGCDLLAKRMSEYHWIMDAAGRITDVPDDTEDDICDALRYLVMNVFPIRKGRSLSASVQDPVLENKQKNPANWMEKIIQEHIQQSDDLDSVETPIGSRGKRGRLLWDL